MLQNISFSNKRVSSYPGLHKKIKNKNKYSAEQLFSLMVRNII